MRLIILIAGCLFFLSASAQQPKSKSNESIRLKTLEGKPLTLPGFAKKLTAIVFLSPDCPLSRNYSIVLKEIQQSWKNDLQVVGVFPGNSNNEEEIKAFRDKYKIDFDLVQDKKLTLVNFSGASITPEVFLYDDQGVLRYKGAIDDWAISLGKKKIKAEHHYLRDAIDHFLQHKAISPAATSAVGCFISQ
ncbi:redoxin domain-containing protein [Chitinophaga horti]|uniref:Redoxin domain-containing protein n=1 Tax=Chitinophaga horti TaxID=2920382 RepID=A0ABY6J6Z3_9BACT|nr:redoxin domain-containing protein [Chitinophaga horti]UYQ95450.1 redoxin domain-containing protein [Chitinophaga horti]